MIFIDRSIPRSVARALQLVRNDVIWLDDVFSHDTPDEGWLARAGSEGWLVVTRDKRIRHRPGERGALLRAGVGCFVLVQSKNPSRWEYLQLLAKTLDAMVDVHQREERPFVFTVDRAGNLERLV